MKFDICDIVRLKKGQQGLFEITGVYENKVYDYSITNDECDTERYETHNNLIFVCSMKDRKDI